MSEPIPETPPTPPALPEPTSLAARLVNVYVSPGDVFDEVAASPRDNGNWVLPLILSAVMSVVFCFAVFSQENVVRNVLDTQEKEIRKQVDAGKMPKEAAVGFNEAAGKYGSVIMIAFGSLFAIIGCIAMLFIVALVLMLVGRFAFGTDVAYLKMAEVSGLAAMITLLGSIAKMFVVIATGRIEIGVSPAALVENFNPGNHTHALLGILDLSMFWYVAVLACGLSRVCGVKWWRAAAWLFSLWFLIAASMAAMAFLGARAS